MRPDIQRSKINGQIARMKGGWRASAKNTSICPDLKNGGLKMRKFNIQSTGTSGLPANVGLIMEIIMLILKLLFSGKSENEAFRIASSKYNIPVGTIKGLWNNRNR